jgi:hypothetical protein
MFQVLDKMGHALPAQEDRSLLITLRSMTEEEIAAHGPLPAAAKKRRRGAVAPGSCFRSEALPPTAGFLAVP